MREFVSGDEELDGEDDVEGEGDYEIVGAQIVPARGGGRRRPGGLMLSRPGNGGIAKPKWMKKQVAPGVALPQGGVEALPLVPQQNNGLFTQGGITSCNYIGTPQRPFRGQRLLVTVERTGGATARLLGQIFVGTAPQQLQLGNLDLEVFAASSFGVAFRMAQSGPGILVQIQTQLSSALGAGQTLQAFITLMGESFGN